MSSKRYTEEFKIEAVKQVAEGGYPVAETTSSYIGRMSPAKFEADYFSWLEGV